MKRVKHWWRQLSLRAKLVGTFLMTILLAFSVNLHMYQKTSQLTSSISSVYDSSISISALREQLDAVQDSLYHYLDGDYDALNRFYQEESTLSRQAFDLNGSVYDNQLLLQEKNIKNMIASYLALAEHAVGAYRGNDVRQYSRDYDAASRLLGYLDHHIQVLSERLFDQNTRSSQNLTRIHQYAQVVNLALMVLMTLTELWVIVVATEQLTYPLKLLSERTNLVGQGQLELPPLKVYSDDEVGRVTDEFNRMTVRLKEHILRQQEQLKEENRLKEEQLRLESALKEAQLNALQSQINPHFLYNTLNAGEQLALMEDAERTCLFLEKTSNYFRYNLRRSGGVVTLEEELTQAENYIYIMNTRFDGEILYLRRYDRPLPSIRLPGMILQPLVENAIEHGLRPMEEDKCLRLTVTEDEERVIVAVSDNGAGFDPQKAHILLSSDGEDIREEGSTHGIGMFNVLRRLRLYCGRRDVMEIGTMENGTGTEIRLLLPKEK